MHVSVVLGFGVDDVPTLKNSVYAHAGEHDSLVLQLRRTLALLFRDPSTGGLFVDHIRQRRAVLLTDTHKLHHIVRV